MLNSVIMMGRLTADPELRQTPQGVNVCSFTIAVERSFAKQGEERQTDFFDVVAWRSGADFVSRFFTKGQMIAVQGRMETRTYDDKNGVRRKAYTIVAESLNFCGGKSEQGQTNTTAPDIPYTEPQNDYQSMDEVDDDLPF